MIGSETIFAWVIAKAVIIVVLSLSCLAGLIWVAAKQTSLK